MQWRHTASVPWEWLPLLGGFTHEHIPDFTALGQSGFNLNGLFKCSGLVSGAGGSSGLWRQSGRGTGFPGNGHSSDAGRGTVRLVSASDVPGCLSEERIFLQIQSVSSNFGKKRLQTVFTGGKRRMRQRSFSWFFCAFWSHCPRRWLWVLM